VLVAGVAPQRQRAARGERVGRERLLPVPRPGQAGDAQPALGELRRVASQERPGLRVDELVPGQPDLASIVRVPVALGELDGYLNERILNVRPLFEAYCPWVEPVQTR
jgi:hypothetical protein